MSRFFRLVCLVGFFFLFASVAAADFSTASKNLSNSALDSLYPKIAGTDGSANVFVIWMEYADATEQRLYCAKSTDGGTTWGGPVQLSAGGQIYQFAGPYLCYSICVNEPFVHIVYNWRANDTDDWEIYYLRSVDLGATWDPPVQLSVNTSTSLYPDVAAQGNYVHITYQDDWPGNTVIMYKRISDNGGGAVDQTRRLTFSGSSSIPRIAVSLSGLHINIVYQDNYSGWKNIFYKHIYDSGAGPYDSRQLTFGTNDNHVSDITTSSGATNGEYVYIVYSARWPGNLDIMYKRLDNWGGAGFSTYTARLSYSATDGWAPAVDFDSSTNNVHICYDDDWPGNREVIYRKLPDYGGGGFTGQRVSWGAGTSAYATVTSAGAWAHIVWMDNTSGNYEIYVKYGY
jgi:hypothetical protein